MADQNTEYSRIDIIGAGAIGSGIAQLLSSLGVETVIVALRPGGVERAAGMMRHCYQHDVKRGRISPAEAGMERIHVTADHAGLAGAEFVIDLVPENLEVKLGVLRAVEANTGDDCIFGTNTSSIPIAMLAVGSRRRANVVGMHYFWPVHRSKLVEIAFTPGTARRTIERTLAMIRWQGKTLLLVKDLTGFFATRILILYINEAVALVADGAPIEAVEKAMTDFAREMGPFQLMDGACAAILRPGDDPANGIQAFFTGADASIGDWATVPGNGTKFPPSQMLLDGRDHHIRLAYKSVYSFAIERVAESARSVREKAGWPADQIDWYIPHHQTGRNIIEDAAKAMGQPLEASACGSITRGTLRRDDPNRPRSG